MSKQHVLTNATNERHNQDCILHPTHNNAVEPDFDGINDDINVAILDFLPLFSVSTSPNLQGDDGEPRS
jgi:hypothetical protein